MNHFNRLMTDEGGLSMVEYALLAALIAGVAVSTISGIADAINAITRGVFIKLVRVDPVVREYSRGYTGIPRKRGE